ncbi:MAG TPA: Ig-like domain-containing protein [Solirubrobacterales bacterium]|nr:Ig-like domain-containing protein [Solirubrobacterales bacterium]
MAGTRGGVGRIVAMVAGLAICVCLLLAGTARANRYLVIQCKPGAGVDADWWDSTGGAKFYPDAYCDGGSGDHAKSFTRSGASTVSGEQFARWRWLAPAGTYLTKISGDWWHALHDGMEQRLGSINWAGGFEPKLGANGTDTTQRYFELGFPVPVAGFEDRLLCARGGDKWCSLGEQSWSGIKDMTIEMEDEKAPQAGIGGELAAGGWHHGTQSLAISGSDVGSGVHYGETLIDGARAALTEYPCAATWSGGALVSTRMGPCYPAVGQSQSIDTTRFSDGNHSLVHCVYDFAGAQGCTAAQTLGIDNNPPAHPRPVTIAAGGEGWHRVNRFELSWTNPDQGPASPIWGAFYRITGQNGFDSGVNFVPGRDVAALPPLTVPGPGAWNLHLWLRDEAGNESAATGIDIPLRFDDQPPTVAFPNDDSQGARITATAADALAGPATGTISYRRAESQDWTDLPTKLDAAGPGKATLSAPLPDLPAGTWVFRAEAGDAAGNTAASSLHADGTQMSIHVKPADVAAGKDDGKRDGGRSSGGKNGDRKGDRASNGPAGRRAKTRLFVRLRGGHGRGDMLTVPFGAPALLSGRLTTAAGAGLSGRRIKVVVRPSHGALAPRTVERITTGERGGFVLRLGPGTSRRLSASFPGNHSLAPARHRSLDLRVRAGVTLAAAPGTLRTGESVRLSGRVRSRGAPIPRRGKLVAIQYLEAETGRWRPVLVTRTDHDGRFRARYLFRYVSATARIRLRATALAEERWPYAPGSSAPVTVEVHGG